MINLKHLNESLNVPVDAGLFVVIYIGCFDGSNDIQVYFYCYNFDTLCNVVLESFTPKHEEMKFIQ